MRWLAVAALTILVAACGHSGGGEGDRDGAAPRHLAGEIAVNRIGCTPFGPPPRPLALGNGLANAVCLGGENLRGWRDGEGTLREACLYEPPQASPEAKLPLVVYLHPSLLGPESSLLLTNVRTQIDTANLSGDRNRPGFILLAPLGRVTKRFYPFPNNIGLGWDNWYRQLSPDGGSRRVNGEDWPQNPDAAAIDHFIDEVVARGGIDTDRIYIMGWSNGGALGILYTLNRPRIAAAAVYTAPNPFNAFNDPCRQVPVDGEPGDDSRLQLLAPGKPIYHVHNDCDFAGICPNALALKASLADGRVTQIQDQIINSLLLPVEACLDICGVDPLADYAGLDDPLGYGNLAGYSLGVANHTRWPLNWTEEMFTFLREHPR